MQFNSASCVLAADFYSSWLALVLVPIALTALLLGLYAVHVRVTKADTLGADKLWLQYTKSILFSLYLLFPRVSSTALALYRCESQSALVAALLRLAFTAVNGQSFLTSDFHVTCYDSKFALSLAPSARS